MSFSTFLPNMTCIRRYDGWNNNDLVQHLKSSEIIMTDSVFMAMSSVDRANYTSFSGNPYSDATQCIEFGATISAPRMHAEVLELLEDKLRTGNRVLDVGSGSGYLTACMGVMLGNEGLAVGIDHILELQIVAEQNVQHDRPDLLGSGRVMFAVGDERLGCPKYGPYNAIHVGTPCREIPQALINQLAPGGRMLVPLVPVGPKYGKQFLVQVDKRADGKVNHQSLMEIEFLPLMN